MNTMVTNKMIMAATLGLNQEIEQMEDCATTQTNKNLIVALLTQAMALKEKGYNRDIIEDILIDNAWNMIDFALEAIFE